MVLHAALRQRRGQHLQAMFQIARDVERIGAVLRGGLHQYPRAPVDDRIAETRCGPVAHLGNIRDAQRHPAAGCDHRLPERLERAPRRLYLQHDALGRSLQVATARHLRAAPRRLGDVLERERRRVEFCRIDPQLPLARIPAEDLCLRHPRHREDLGLDGPAHQVAQLKRRQALAGEAEVQQVLHRGAQRRELRRTYAARQECARIGQTLGDHLALQVRIAVTAKHHLNRRQSLARGRAHGLDVLRSGEQILQRPGYQGFHLGRIEPGSLGLHEHMRRGEIRKHVEARVQQRGRPQQSDEQGERCDDPRMRQRPSNDGGKHGC